MAQGTVFSVNAVGYVNTTMKKGFNLVANPLIAADNTVASLFKSTPFGTQVYKFNGTGFDIATNDDLEGKFVGTSANAAVNPGEGVFVKNNTAGDFTVTFVGEVPQGALSNPLPKGLSIRSSQVPQEGKITTDLAFPAAPGDQVFKYTGTGYTIFTFDDLENAWTRAGVKEEPVLGVGESVFVRKVAAGTWTRNFSVNQ